MIKYLFLLLFPFLIAEASNSAGYFKYGLSVGQDLLPSSKLFSFGYQQELPRQLFIQYDVGVVNTPGYDTRAAVLAGASLGLTVQPSYSYRLQASWGPAFYSRRDQHLGGPFQFNHDLCFDFTDSYNFTGVCYKHVSSAGIYSPNKGIDAASLRLGVTF